MANSLRNLLSFTTPTVGSCRFTSSKYYRAHPRSYRRRLYEAALKPNIPPELIARQELLENGDIFDFQPPAPAPSDFTEVDLAEVRMIREWIRAENYRVMGVCQLLFVPESPRWLAQNQFRLRGLEFKTFRPKVIRKVFESTPFSVLEGLHDENTVLLFGRETDTLRSLVTECAKYGWITLLAGTLDNRIFDVPTLEKMAKLSSLEDLRAETTQILGQLPASLVHALDHVPRQMINALDAHSVAGTTADGLAKVIR